jgi:hypothetical protein
MKKVITIIAAIVVVQFVLVVRPAKSEDTSLWDLYSRVFEKAKYVDLTHAFGPTIAVWPGFGNAKFKPAVAGREYTGYCKKGEPFDYDKHGFIASAYELVTDQYGTQLPDSCIRPHNSCVARFWKRKIQTCGGWPRIHRIL